MSGSHVPALRAPVFWLALLVLVVNDHVLKGAGVAPLWLTGKLSDFAGLVVAPIVAAELCRGPLQRLRMPAASLVVLAFAATELFAPAARALESALGVLGIDWRLWSDPTDLFALAVLPLTFRLLAPRPAARTLGSRERLAIALASVACLATADVKPFAYRPFLVNHAGVAIEVRARFFEDVSCEQPLSALAADLAAGAQPTEHVLPLAPTEVTAIDATPPASASITSACGWWHPGDDRDDAGFTRPTPCVAVLISADGLPPHLMRALRYWTRDAEPSRCAARIPVYEDPDEGALVVAHGRGGALRLVAHQGLELLPLP